ncbi:protein disulfide isomerase [Lycorma delicatula]|uniref:protein disulfide isomerase n=1 Tax=Lycorma delicatula TaxID=130591 RepID=UPI003F517D71
MYTTLLLNVLLIISSVVYCEEDPDSKDAKIEKDGHVLVFNKDNFKAGLALYDYILVEFYAPWCGHCKALEPIFEEAAKKLEDKKSPIKLAKIDAIENKELAVSFGIRGYPTLKFFRKGKTPPLDYSGDRKAEVIISWLEKKIGSPAQEFSSVDDLKAFYEEHNVAVVGFFKDPESEKGQTFLNIADSIDHLPFAIVSEDSVFKEHNVDEEHKVILFKKFDEGKAHFEADEFNEANLRKFVITESLPLIVDFNHETAQKIFGGEINSHLLFFLSQSSGHYDSHLEGPRAVAKEYRDKILFVTINADEEDHQRILEFFGMKKDEIPAMRIIKMAEDMAKYKPEKQDFSAEYLKNFVEQFIDGKLKQHLLSQDVPDDWDKHPVKVLVANNFDEVAFDKEKDVLVEFYAPWCGHCKQLAPIYDELGEAFKDNPNVIIAKMDATANELEHTKITSFPTLKLYAKGDNKVIEYNGERTLEGLTKFLETGGEYGKAPSRETEEEDEDDDLPRKDEL